VLILVVKGRIGRFSRFGKVHYNAYESVVFWRNCIIVQFLGTSLKKVVLPDFRVLRGEKFMWQMIFFVSPL
jgi:hypothetical protein